MSLSLAQADPDVAAAVQVKKPEELVDSTVRVRGVCSTLFNHQRQLFAIRLAADDNAAAGAERLDVIGHDRRLIALEHGLDLGDDVRQDPAFPAKVLAPEDEPVPALSAEEKLALLGQAEQKLTDTFQALAAQGISVFVSSADNGPAGCDHSSQTFETGGYAVSGEASSPYAVAVGGSEGYEGANLSTYWNLATELTPPYWGLSAIKYYPETPWNEALGADVTSTASGKLSGLWSGSGGISAYHLQPSWQRGPGVPSTDPTLVGGNWVTDYTITNPGSGYTAAPTVTFTGGGCTGEPQATAGLSSGSVAGLNFTYYTSRGQGIGCTSAPTVTFSAAPAGGTTATATVTVGPMQDPAPLITGVPHRYLPDLALNAASGHDGTLYCSEGVCQFSTSGNTTTMLDAGIVGGTSVAAPSMAGIQALINQANGGRQGSPNYIYYSLAAAQSTTNCNSSLPPAAGSNCQ